SDPNSKIDLLDETKSIKKKIGSAYCLPGDINDNTPLELVRMLIFPVLKRLNHSFVIERPEKYGGRIIYNEYDALELDYKTVVPVENSDNASAEIHYKLHPS